MIPLRIRVDPLPIDEPLVIRLRSTADAPDPSDALLIDFDGEVAEYDLAGFSLRLHATDPGEIDNDVLLIVPGQRSAHRLVRANSAHNTFLVTEQCDQLCVMCSQPPKPHHVDLFPYFTQAARLAPRDVYIGVSGGEPMLHKQELFAFLIDAIEARPDLRFHILTNGQHFEESDLPWLAGLPGDRVLWGIPLYSEDADVHDAVVAKPGAFFRLMRSFSILAKAGAAIELRTVVMRSNADGLPALARLVTKRLPFVSVWALMQLESIGFGRKNWDTLFLDSSVAFREIATAVDICRARGLETLLYNFPACTVPAAYRSLAPSTISDWKRRYLRTCEGCNARDTCSGFFEWYPEAKGFAGITAL